MKIYAHRGASAEFPENTLIAFRRAIDIRADGIELDVHLSSDGVPVVIHDETLDRTTNGAGPVDGMTADELGRLDAGRGEGVPTLDAVLALAAGHVHVNIEIKSGAAGRATLDVVDRHPDLRWAISSFDWTVLREVKAMRPGVDLWPTTYGPRASLPAMIEHLRGMEHQYPGAARWAESLRTTGNVLEAALDLGDELGSTALSVGHYGLTGDAVRLMRDRGFAAWAWTVNDPERAGELASWGVEYLCTDEPGIMLRTNLAVAR